MLKICLFLQVLIKKAFFLDMVNKDVSIMCSLMFQDLGKVRSEMTDSQIESGATQKGTGNKSGGATSKSIWSIH